MILNPYRFSPLLSYSNAILLQNPRLYYKLDETSGTQFYNSSSYPLDVNNQTTTLDLVYGTTILYNQSPLVGGSLRSISTGSSTQIRTAGGDWLPSNYIGPWSFMATIKATQSQLPHYIVSRGQDYEGDGWSLLSAVGVDREIVLVAIVGGAGYSVTSPINSYIPDTSATITITHSLGIVKIYNNSVLIHTGSIPYSNLRQSSIGAIIGGGNFDQFNKGGCTDEVALFDYELTQSQISFMHENRNNL